MISLLMVSGSMVSANFPSRKAAALLTIGVSSRHSLPYSCRNSDRKCMGARGFAVAKTPQAETREVNHSVVASRCIRNDYSDDSVTRCKWLIIEQETTRLILKTIHKRDPQAKGDP